MRQRPATTLVKVNPMTHTHKTLPLWQVLACGAAIVTLSMGVRHGFGLWLQPITQAQDWTRENFAMAIAIQNLTWGFAGIFSGMLADRFGAFRVIVTCAVLYALGLVGMAYSSTPALFTATAGVLIGIAQAGTTYAVIYGVIGRNVSAAKRSWAMGVAAAAGSFGQFLMVPTEGYLISTFGWQEALVWLSVSALLIIPLAYGLREPGFGGGATPYREQSIMHALSEAMSYRSFQLLMAGYFVCGFQVVFIGVHMPSYLKDHNMSPRSGEHCLGADWPVQRVWHLHRGQLGSTHGEAQNFVVHLFFTLGRHRVVLVGATHPHERVHLLWRDGLVMALHRAPNQRSGGANFWCSAFVHVGRLCVF